MAAKSGTGSINTPPALARATPAVGVKHRNKQGTNFCAKNEKKKRLSLSGILEPDLNYTKGEILHWSSWHQFVLILYLYRECAGRDLVLPVPN